MVKTKREIIYNNDGTVSIPLGGSKGIGLYAIVSKEFVEEVSEFNWHLDKHGYCKAHLPTVNGKRKTIKLHRLILKPKESEIVDHVDGNPLNNTLNNLRIVTSAQNNMNKRKQTKCQNDYKGISFHKKSGKWEASIRINGKKIYLKLHNTQKEAARAYDEAALKYFNEYAKVNFPA